MATGKRGVRGREEIMARCPGSGKKCVPQLLRRFKGLRGDARGEGCSGRMLAATVGRSQTAPGMQGSRWANGKLTSGSWEHGKFGWIWKMAAAGRQHGDDVELSFGGRRHTLCSSTLLSTGVYFTWHTRDWPPARVPCRGSGPLVLLSSGKASRAPAYGGC